MSPTKPSTSASTRLQRPVGRMASGIPRRIKTSEDNKENIPLSGVVTRSRSNRANGSSPTRGKSGISKATPSILQRSALARLPLRELSEGEIFERDGATLGDLRRRRSGEHSGSYVEFDSHTAQPVATRASSTVSASAVTTRSQATAATEVIEEVGEKECGGKIRVLRRTDSEEALRVKVKTIMAATSVTAAADWRESIGDSLVGNIEKRSEEP